MHDTESDTFVYQSWPEKFSGMLKEIGIDSEAKEIGTDEIEKDEKEIGIDSEAKEIGTDEIEKDDYYSRYFAQTPRMVTNKGCIDVKNSNIDG
jgi:hypothetical protein